MTSGPTQERNDEYVLSRGDVSHRLGLSPERVRQLGVAGILPSRQTRLGRLYHAGAVEALAAKRSNEHERGQS